LNYLAHAYLSFNNPEILAGNMISDFVKGKKKFNYAAGIQKGIALHRAIDEFTDNHEVTKEAKKIFKPAYGLYSGAFIDVVYDHFLATDPNQFPGNALEIFTQKTYLQLQNSEPVFPDRFQEMFFYMRSQNWLYNYQFKEGINKSFGGLVRRAAYMHEHNTAFQIFETHYNALKNYYQLFFPHLKSFAFDKFSALLKGS
jgi:acyl carrier protein phosphodiesterase